MEIGPIFRAMRSNRLKVGLLIFEIAATLAVVVTCLHIIDAQTARLSRDSGVAEDQLIMVQLRHWDELLGERETRKQQFDADLVSLRSMPDVLSAAGIHTRPLQGGGSSTQIKPLGTGPEALVRSPYYQTDWSAIETLGLEIVAGRDLTPDDMAVEAGPYPANVLVTQDLADALFPDGDALGQALDTGSEEYPDTIVGIIDHMVTPYGGSAMESRILFYPSYIGSSRGITYAVRAERGNVEAVAGALTDRLLEVNDQRTVRVQTLLEVRGMGYMQERLIAGILWVLVGLLLFVTGVGIFGMASHSVTSRIRQIGTRRALGAKRWEIVRYFIVESTMIAMIGVGIGLVGAFGLDIALVNALEMEPLGAGLAASGASLIWLVSLSATALPARRAAAVPPSLATRAV